VNYRVVRCLQRIGVRIQVRTLYELEENTMDIIRALEQEGMKQNLPNLKIGDYVKVNVKVKEGSRERIQVFEGTIIAMRGTAIRKAITVRRLSYGIGVERVFPLHSPKVDSVEIIRRGKVRRAKLYYLRDRVGKAARIKEDLSTSKD
jgi:large subunit ribosomal protein L19